MLKRNLLDYFIGKWNLKRYIYILVITNFRMLKL